jgi:aldose 1-epimerase
MFMVDNLYVRLKAGDLAATLLPTMGGSVASFRWNRGTHFVDLMRPLSDEALTISNSVDAAMFPMFPYANRIERNQFDFAGRTYIFYPNFPGEPLNLHGTGWQSVWAVTSLNEAYADLTLEQTTPNTPYSYSASQLFVLERDRLRVTLRLTNRGEFAMPFGFGLHPWWTRESDVTLQFAASHFWLEGPGYVATDRITLPRELDFSQPRLLPKTWRNNCYSGWDGRAKVCFPYSGFGLCIEADSTFRHLMLYSDPAKSVFCLEPQTHAPGALNRLGRNVDDDLGIIILGPRESAEGTVSFIPFELGQKG